MARDFIFGQNQGAHTIDGISYDFGYDNIGWDGNLTEAGGASGNPRNILGIHTSIADTHLLNNTDINYRGRFYGLVFNANVDSINALISDTVDDSDFDNIPSNVQTPNGGTAIVPNTIPTYTGDIDDAKNMEFVEWNTMPDGSGIRYIAGDSITGITAEIMLYAQWKGVLRLLETPNLWFGSNYITPYTQLLYRQALSEGSIEERPDFKADADAVLRVLSGPGIDWSLSVQRMTNNLPGQMLYNDITVNSTPVEVANKNTANDGVMEWAYDEGFALIVSPSDYTLDNIEVVVFDNLVWTLSPL